MYQIDKNKIKFGSLDRSKYNNHQTQNNYFDK